MHRKHGGSAKPALSVRPGFIRTVRRSGPLAAPQDLNARWQERRVRLPRLCDVVSTDGDPDDNAAGTILEVWQANARLGSIGAIVNCLFCRQANMLRGVFGRLGGLLPILHTAANVCYYWDLPEYRDILSPIFGVIEQGYATYSCGTKHEERRLISRPPTLFRAKAPRRDPLCEPIRVHSF